MNANLIVVLRVFRSGLCLVQYRSFPVHAVRGSSPRPGIPHIESEAFEAGSLGGFSGETNGGGRQQHRQQKI